MEFLRHFLFMYLIRDTISFCGTDPSGIKVTTQSAKSIHVAWDTTKTNCGITITGYRIYFNSIAPFITYKTKDVSGATKDNVEIFPIVPGFSYIISVKELTTTGAISNPTFINYTHPHTRLAAAPGNIHASTKRITSLTISWDAINIFTRNGDVKGYQVYYRGQGLNGTKSAIVLGEANHEFTVTDLRPNSTYQFILTVVNDVGPGPYSGFIPISTLPSATTSTTTTTPLPTTTPTAIPKTTTTSPTTSPKPPTTTNTATTPTKTTTIPKSTSSTTSESTTQRTTRFERQKNPSSQIIITTTLPRLTHTAITTLKHGKLNSGQIAGIVICCVLTVCVLIVWYILWSSERTRKWIKIRRIQPINRQQ